MASKVSRNSVGRPATVEDVDDQGRPVIGTKKAATTNTYSTLDIKQDLRSDSGYSSHTGNTMAALASAEPAPRAPPRVPEPPEPVKPAIPTPPAPRPRSFQDRSISDTKASPLPEPSHRQSYHGQQPTHPSQFVPQPCRDPNCNLPHYRYPPHPSQQQYLSSSDRRYEQLPEYVRPTNRALRRVRPISYHEDTSRGLDHLYARLGDGKSVDVPGTYAGTILREPYYQATIPFETSARPSLRHTLTDTARPSYVDPRDMYEGHLTRLPYYSRMDLPKRRQSDHGHSSTGSGRSSHRGDRALALQNSYHEPDYATLQDQLEARLTLRDYNHERRHFPDPYQRPTHGEMGERRSAKAYEYEDERPRPCSQSTSRRSRSPRSVHLERRSSRRSPSPSRRLVRVYEPDRHREEPARPRSSHHDSALEAQLLEAQRYMNQVRRGSFKDEPTASMRNDYTPLYGSKPAFRQGSVSSSSKSYRSHGREHSHSRSSRRNSDFRVNVEVINDGERVQAFSMRADKPLTFTVDDAGVQHHAEPRPERTSNTSSVMSWLSGARSRAGSDDREGRRSSRRRMSIRSPIIEDRWESRR